jgi:predicted DNA-binding transcriptional regulator YafY
MIIALQAHPGGLSGRQLMAAAQVSEERTFERAKDTLRSVLGVALEESAKGHYKLGEGGYAMAPLRFTAPEHAAIALALGAWRGSEVEWAARAALTKLAPLSDDLAPAPAPPGRPDAAAGLNTALYAPAAGAGELIAAIAERRRVEFDYVTGASGRLARRQVEPWRLAKRGGAWYLLGFDLDRQAERVYKLGRMIGPVTLTGRAAAFDPPAAAWANARLKAALDGQAAGPGRVRATPTAARVLALQGARATPEAGVWELPNADPFELAAWGDQLDVIGPERLGDQVRERWRGAAAAHAGTPAAPQPYPSAPRRRARPAGQSRAAGEQTARQPKQTGAARAARLVSLVSYLRDRGTVRLVELAERFGVTPAEVHRDLYLLWMDVGRSRAGGDLLDFAWSEDESEVALVDSQGLDHPVPLSAVEAISLVAALRSVEEAGGLSESTAAGSARAKLESALGAASVVDFNLPAGGPQLETLRQAISRDRRLVFDYVDRAGAPSRRRVDPLEVFNAGDHWLLAAWDLGAEAERHFRVDRITDARLAEAAESHPYRPRRRGWSQRAELVVDAVFAPSERWRAEELETLAPPLALPGGALQVRLGVVNPDWITAMALGGGGAIEVLGPAELRGRIEHAARSALR